MARYYSNSFTDVEKQAAINLFLGVYCPEVHHARTVLWNLESDKFLHFPELKTGMMCRSVSMTQSYTCCTYCTTAPLYLRLCCTLTEGRNDVHVHGL